MTENKRKIAVIGAGVGGLATAARLAHRGFEVDVFEKMPRCGGRANVIEDQGFKFDTGPSFVLMPDFFEEVFSNCGENISDYLDLKQLDISYKLFYPDGEVLTIYADTEKTKLEFERIESGAAAQYDLYIQELERMYKEVKPLLYECFTPKQMFNPVYWGLLGKLKAFNTYWQTANKYFKNEKLCYALTFQSMFIGVSPFEAPAFYSIITYADHIQKVFHPMGGMHQIPKALEKLGKKLGVRFHYNTEIHQIRDKNGKVAINNQQENYEADKVVINADYPYAKNKLLNAGLKDYSYSCSVYLMYLGLKKKVKGLDHHCLFFSEDVRKNLKGIFQESRVVKETSFYVHVPTMTDSSLAPEGKDLLYILVPVPNLKKSPLPLEDYESDLRRLVFTKLKEVTEEDVEELIEVEHKFIPQDFIGRYNLQFGSAFGLAHNLLQSAFFRPPNRDNRHPNVYYVGASSQPGGGLPPVIAGSRITADLICESV